MAGIISFPGPTGEPLVPPALWVCQMVGIMSLLYYFNLSSAQHWATKGGPFILKRLTFLPFSYILLAQFDTMLLAAHPTHSSTISALFLCFHYHSLP